jgi:tRNA A37 threonylcarbamoyladenosine biosynthesis protein TsaE
MNTKPRARRSCTSICIDCSMPGRLRERRGEGAIVLVEWGAQAVAAIGGDPTVSIELTIAGQNQRTARIAGSRADDLRMGDR